MCRHTHALRFIDDKFHGNVVWSNSKVSGMVASNGVFVAQKNHLEVDTRLKEENNN